MMGPITVHKLDERGREIWRYQGRLLERTATFIRLIAQFDREGVQAGPLRIEKGDPFLETFYSDRWYNQFAIFRGENGGFCGWYCNIARPAQLEEQAIYQEDLALDLIVLPQGETAVLDRDEFDQLDLSEAERSWALATLRTLEDSAQRGRPPFTSAPSLPENQEGLSL